MATHANSTLAPTRQRGLLPLAANRREIPGSSLTAQPLSGVVASHDTLAEIEAEFASLIAQPWPDPDQLSGNPGPLRAQPLAAPESTAGQPCIINDLRPDEALASTTSEGLLSGPAPLPSLTSAELDALLAVQGRPTPRFRALVTAAAHGAALLDALDLPPLALDVLDVAIAALDSRDGDFDLEDDGTAEAEPDGESSLGWPNDFRAQLDPGRNWEADYDREAVNEDGSDDGREDHGWFAGEFDVPQVMRGMVEDARRQPAVSHG